MASSKEYPQIIQCLVQAAENILFQNCVELNIVYKWHLSSFWIAFWPDHVVAIMEFYRKPPVTFPFSSLLTATWLCLLHLVCNQEEDAIFKEKEMSPLLRPSQQLSWLTMSIVYNQCNQSASWLSALHLASLHHKMFKTKLVHCCDVVQNMVVEIENFNFCLFVCLYPMFCQFRKRKMVQSWFQKLLWNQDCDVIKIKRYEICPKELQGLCFGVSPRPSLARNFPFLVSTYLRIRENRKK